MRSLTSIRNNGGNTMKKAIMWLKGLLSAAIGGAANGICVTLVDPQSFNIGDGIGNLGAVCGAGAVLAAANYLKKAPLPSAE